MKSAQQLCSLLQQGTVSVITDTGVYDTSCLCAEKLSKSLLYETDVFTLCVRIFTKGGLTAYRSICLTCKQDLTLYRLDFALPCPADPEEFLFYRSFLDAPAAAFIRYAKEGLFTGIENPFFTASANTSDQICLSYEPSLLLKKGEVYESEPQFLGSYDLSGEAVTEAEPICIESLRSGLRRPRFFNPCPQTPLDRNEIEAMRSYVTEYYDVIQKSFENILYFFFYPKKAYPQTAEEIADYTGTIDRFAAINGDIIAFNPHVNTVLPTSEHPYWELAPKGSAAETLLTYTQSKGLRCGYYMGCAFNGTGGNAALLPFMPEQTAWKKLDRFGNLSSENCLACDDYLDWWYHVQKNTIEKYKLGYWSWDPGPGNGNDCYAPNHGHIPGKGAYKGWRNSQKLLMQLKQTFPELFLMSFYGRKEYGIWGFRYFSQHEVYWEQTILYGATLHNDLHDDRVNAHGTRLQNLWSMNFRFLPAHIGHGLVPRMGESYYDPALDKACDPGGYQYALLSAIACCGSVTHCTLPDRLERIPGFLAFYRKWIRWAKDNYRYCSYTRPLANTVSNWLIDGVSRIDGQSGQIFLFNSSPKTLRKQLVLDERVGLLSKEPFSLHILYWGSRGLDEDSFHYGDTYVYGDILDITLAPYDAIVLEIDRTSRPSAQNLPANCHTVDCFWDASGKPFSYPVHPAAESLTLFSHAYFPSDVQTALEAARQEDADFLSEKIQSWHEAGMPFTCVGAQPHHLTFYFPFDGPVQPAGLRLWINDREVPVETFYLAKMPLSRYAFVEDYICWDADNRIQLTVTGLCKNSFMGIYADYPDSSRSMSADQTVFPEYPPSCSLHYDPSLLITDFSISPKALNSTGETFSVTVTTEVSCDLIETVYFIHPTQAAMPALTHIPGTKQWSGTFRSGNRALNIFCNPVISAWIQGKDGGVGPRVPLSVDVRYSK